LGHAPRCRLPRDAADVDAEPFETGPIGVAVVERAQDQLSMARQTLGHRQSALLPAIVVGEG
jgi:hypothetical protein